MIRSRLFSGLAAVCGFQDDFWRPAPKMRSECYKAAFRGHDRLEANVEAVDAGRGRAPDPRDDGAQGHCREAGQYPHRDGLREMRRAQSHLGGKGGNAGEIHLQAMRAKARDAVRGRPPSVRGAMKQSSRAVGSCRRVTASAFAKATADGSPKPPCDVS